ncbi:MAG: ECF transporter S component [Breznakia sp.]
MKHYQTKKLSILALFIALEIAMSVFPFLGFIPLGFINATTLHIPVILGSILLGKKEGAVLGFLFGLLSLIRATTQPNLTSFIFSPFISVGGMHGNFASLLIVFIPRILMGYIAGFLFENLSKKEVKEYFSLIISAFIGSMCNTLLVVGGIIIFFSNAYASALGIEIQALFGSIVLLIVTSGISEAFVACFFILLLYKTIHKAFPKLSKVSS